MVAASYGAEVKTRSVQWGRHCEIHREEAQKSENPTNRVISNMVNLHLRGHTIFKLSKVILALF